MSYLPEAHTDFMLAILGEEFGFFGIATVLALSFAMLFAVFVSVIVL
jgi:cell division protein FtsW